MQERAHEYQEDPLLDAAKLALVALETDCGWAVRAEAASALR